ncbi:hypothetical protein A1D30_10380 [Acidovorax sp. GW101-3H11]|nr:hypothetical protein A1D30_10380 [Acidovorax sp. GW101-3H11]
MLKRYEGGAFYVFESWLADVADEFEFTKRIALCIGKRMQQESLTNAVFFGHQRVLDGYIG